MAQKSIPIWRSDSLISLIEQGVDKLLLQKWQEQIEFSTLDVGSAAFSLSLFIVSRTHIMIYCAPYFKDNFLTSEFIMAYAWT